jgi:hypothetical protein
MPTEKKGNKKYEVRDSQEHLKEMKAQMASLISWVDAQQERMMACLGRMEAMDLEANPEEKESEAEHREVPKEDEAVKPVGALKKQHSGWHLAAGHRGKLKEWTQGKDGCQKKLAATCRDDSLCKSGMEQGTSRTRQGQGCTKNFIKTDVWKEASAEPGTQQWDKEPRPETAATKQEGIHQDLQENHWTGDHEANCQIYCRV